jgi:hypothetical protein
MRLATGLATACTIAVVGVVPASAAPAKPKACNLIVDDKGDSAASAVPGDESVDILSGDLASNAKTVSGAIRLSKLTNPNPQAPFGQVYFILFSVKGSPDTLTLSATLSPAGTQFKYGYEGVDPNTGVNTSYTLGDAQGTVSGNEIRIWADIAKFPQAKLIKPNVKTTLLEAEARRMYGQRFVPSQEAGGVRVPLGGVTLVFDEAAGKSYYFGQSSCLPVGK